MGHIEPRQWGFGLKRIKEAIVMQGCKSRKILKFHSLGLRELISMRGDLYPIILQEQSFTTTQGCLI